MQVKKFEAPTMFEALEMVKNQLGPEAIILNAKDNSRSFGLMGKKSIEITAAISERQLLKKQYAESRLQEPEKQKLRIQPARIQKEFIERSVDKYMRAQQEQQEQLEQEKRRRHLTKVRYIDIEDNEEAEEELPSAQTAGRTVDDLLKELSRRDVAGNTAKKTSVAPEQKFTYQPTSQQRVKAAAESALKAFQESDRTIPQTMVPTIPKPALSSHFSEVQLLKNEIMTLKSIIQQTTMRSQEIQLHPGAERGVSFELSGIYQKLTQAGILENHVLKLIEDAKKDLKDMSSKAHLVEGWIAKHMLSEIKVCDKNAVAPIQIFFGPAGSGKSSHLVKLASYYVIHKNKKVGILSCDSEKVGAIDQLRIYAQILNVPFGILRKPEDWQTVQSSLAGLDHILIDYAGSPLRDLDQIERFQKLLPAEKMSCDRHLVLPATIKDSDASELAQRYKMAHPTDVIFNKLDEAITHGTIYNFQKKYNLPLFSFGIGPQLPEDFEFATKERLVDLIFRISKLKG